MHVKSHPSMCILKVVYLLVVRDN